MEQLDKTFDLWASTTNDGGRGTLSIGMNCFCRWLLRAKVCILRADCEILFKSAVGTGSTMDFPTFINRFVEPFCTKTCTKFDERKVVIDSLVSAVPTEEELAASERFRRVGDAALDDAAARVQRFARVVIARSNRMLVKSASQQSGESAPGGVVRQSSSKDLRERMRAAYSPSSPAKLASASTGLDRFKVGGSTEDEQQEAQSAKEVAADLIRFRAGRPLDCDFLDTLIDVFAALAIANAGNELNQERVLLQQLNAVLLKAGMQKPEAADGQVSRKRGVPAEIVAALYARYGGKPLRGLDADAFLVFVAAVAEAAFPTMPVPLRDQCVKDLLCCAVEALHVAKVAP